MENELIRLKTSLLPTSWSPTGAYSDEEIDRARGYRVLAHAEIEHYLEEVLRAKILWAKANYKLNLGAANLVISLVVVCAREWTDEEIEVLQIDALPMPKLVSTASDPFLDVLDRCFNKYFDIVGKNHGVKRKNLKLLLMPFGIPLSSLDAVWLNDMDAFGTRRGEFAHKTRLGLSLSPDPKAEYDDVQRILPELINLDDRIQAL